MKHRFINAKEVKKLVHENGKQATDEYLCVLNELIKNFIIKTTKLNGKRYKEIVLMNPDICETRWSAGYARSLNNHCRFCTHSGRCENEFSMKEALNGRE